MVRGNVQCIRNWISYAKEESLDRDLAEHVNPKRVRWSDAKPKQSFELYKYCIV